MASAATTEPLFVEIDRRRLFCLLFKAPVRAHTRVLVLPPFAEELNKCRRVVSRSARALASIGCDVLVPDLFGTGDSAGDFGEATWRGWLDDIAALDRWHSHETPGTAVAYLAVRSGALLLEALDELSHAHVLCWQPVLDGGRFLQQFLRLRVMVSKFAGLDESVQSLQSEFQAGRPVEVAGYTLSSELAAGLQASSLSAELLGRARRATLIEFRPEIAASLSVPLARLQEALIGAGVEVRTQLVACEQFWATQEIAAPDAVVEATVAALAGK